MLRTANVAPFTLLITIVVVMLISLWYQKTGKTIYIRRLAAVDAIDEAVGRAVELARPVHFSTGVRSIYHSTGIEVLAGMEILGYLARLTARNGARLIATVASPANIPIVESIIREAYTIENRSDEYRSDMVLHLSPNQQAYIGGVQGLFFREKVAANIFIGPLLAEALPIVETGFRVGAMQVSGTASVTGSIPALVAVCEYTLIADEVYAAAAYTSGNKTTINSVLMTDISKAIMVALIVIGTFITLFNNAFINLLKL